MEALGINLKLLLAQVINFSILLFVLNKLLYKPITSMLDERRNKIEKGLEDSEVAAGNLKEAQAKSNEITDLANKEASEILKTTKEAAAKEAAEIVKRANDQAERTLESAKTEAARLKSETLTQAKKEISGLVVAALDRIVKDELDKDTKENLAIKAVKEI